MKAILDFINHRSIGELVGIVIGITVLQWVIRKLVFWFRHRDSLPRIFKPNPKRKGMLFEKKAYKEIRKTFKHLPVFRSLLLPLPGDKTTEIDMVFVCTKGIFAIECKAWGIGETDTVIVKWLSPEWELLPNGTNRSNPFYQNNGHVVAIRDLLNGMARDLSAKARVFNVVILQNLLAITDDGGRHVSSPRRYATTLQSSGKCVVSLSRADSSYYEYRVQSDVPGMELFKQELESMSDVLSPEEAEQIAEVLSARQASKKALKEHVQKCTLFD